MTLSSGDLVLPHRLSTGRLVLGPTAATVVDGSGDLCVPVRLSTGRYSLAKVEVVDASGDIGFPARLSTGRLEMVKMWSAGSSGGTASSADTCSGCSGTTTWTYWKITFTGFSGALSYLNTTHCVQQVSACSWMKGYGESGCANSAITVDIVTYGSSGRDLRVKVVQRASGVGLGDWVTWNVSAVSGWSGSGYGSGQGPCDVRGALGNGVLLLENDSCNDIKAGDTITATINDFADSCSE